MPLMLEGKSFKEAETEVYGNRFSGGQAMEKLPPLHVHRKISGSAQAEILLANLRLGSVRNPAVERAYMDAPVLPSSQSMMKRGKFAVVHSACFCSIKLLALMESADWLLNRLHALRECCVRQGFANHGLDLFRHHRMSA
jgi:hypothetical protein